MSVYSEGLSLSPPLPFIPPSLPPSLPTYLLPLLVEDAHLQTLDLTAGHDALLGEERHPVLGREGGREGGREVNKHV